MPDQLYQLPLTIELLSPVLIARTVGDENMVGSEDYIPGSVLLGAFAGMHIKKYGDVMDTPKKFSEFAELFLSDSIRFLNGYPQIELQKEDKKVEIRSLPIPLSIQYGKEKDASAVEKLFKCRNEKQDDCQDWELVTFEDLLKKSDEKNAAPASKYKSGYCMISANETKLQFRKKTVAKQYQIHHERTNQRVGRSADAEIYNYESIMPNQTFKALILGSQNQLEHLKSLLETNTTSVRLGRSKHTQYGHTTVTADEISEFKTEAETLSVSKLLGVNRLILSCISDLVVPRDTRKINLEVIVSLVAQRLGLNADLLSCVNAFFKTDMVEKYNATWKTRTSAQPCFVKGSCFVLELNGSLDAWKEKLAEIQRDGLGARRNEGYGRVLVNWQGLPIESKKNSPDEELPPPAMAPKNTQPLFQALIKNWLIDLVQVEAAEKAKEVTEKLKIKSNQINKLKRMAINAETFSAFKERIENLNDNSKERLRDQRFGNQHLYDFLRKNPIDKLSVVDDKIKDRKDGKGINEFLTHSDFENYKNNSELQQALFVKYYDTLFTLLDKSLKSSTINQGGQNR